MDDWHKYADSWRIPLKSLYRTVIDFRLKANAEKYIQAGWEPIENYADVTDFIRRIRVKEAVSFYRVGWPRTGGEPVYLPVIDEGSPPRIQDFGPSEN